jgi:hypothetical protein
MPVDINGTFYPDSAGLSEASLSPQLITASVSLPATPFSFGPARDIDATLNIHDFATTALTGPNNDLTFFARTPGAQTIAIRYVDPSANNAALSVDAEKFLLMAQGSSKDLLFVAKDSTKDVTVTYQVGAAGAPLSVAVTGNNIVITAKTTDPGLAADSTASEILTAALLVPAFVALVTATLAPGSSGAGKPAVFSATHLSGSLITVSLATGVAGAITSTSASVKAAIEANSAAAAAVIVQHASGNDGSGVVTALAETALTGPAGTSPTLDVVLNEGSSTITSLSENAAFAQKTTATTEFKKFLSVASYGQWAFTLGGTSNPAFAVSINAAYRR